MDFILRNESDFEPFEMDGSRELQTIDMAVFGARVCTAVSSMFLVMFYSIQMYWKRCNFHPLYVQSVTAMVYTLGAFESSGFLSIQIYEENDFSAPKKIELGRYLFWIMTCPVIIANVVNLSCRLNPEGANLSTTVTLMTKDIVMTSFGIIGAVQSDVAIKYVFVTLAFFLYGWLGYDFYKLARENEQFFPDLHWKWFTAVEIFIFISWTVFPILYVIGSPILGLIPNNADATAHAFADLLAKNVGGFLVWYTRFFLVEPLYESRRVKALALNMGDDGNNTLLKMERAKGRRLRHKDKHNELAVIIVEKKVEIQRLYALMLDFVNIVPTFVFSLEEAMVSCRRDHAGYYDAILISMPQFINCVEEVEHFRDFVSHDPYYIPVLGYSHEIPLSGYSEDLIERLTDGILQHSLDETKILEQINFWKKATIQWREAHRAHEAQKELFIRKSRPKFHADHPNEQDTESIYSKSRGNQGMVTKSPSVDGAMIGNDDYGSPNSPGVGANSFAFQGNNMQQQQMVQQQQQEQQQQQQQQPVLIDPFQNYATISPAYNSPTHESFRQDPLFSQDGNVSQELQAEPRLSPAPIQRQSSQRISRANSGELPQVRGRANSRDLGSNEPRGRSSSREHGDPYRHTTGELPQVRVDLSRSQQQQDNIQRRNSKSSMQHTPRTVSRIGSQRNF